METSYGIYDWFEYAYDVEGRVLGERYPDGRETSYEYETATGRLAAQRFPAVGGASVQNFTRNWYDNVVNGQHAERVIQIAHEFTAGTTAFAWASGMVSDAEGRITQAQLYDQLSFPAARTYRTGGRVASTSARYQTGALTMAYAMDRTYSYSADGSAVGWTTGTTNDVARTLFYDMSNRLLCETSVSGSTSCPTTNTSPFLEAFTYDATDSRLTLPPPGCDDDHPSPPPVSRRRDRFVCTTRGDLTPARTALQLTHGLPRRRMSPRRHPKGAIRGTSTRDALVSVCDARCPTVLDPNLGS
ncbi:MAG: hypothetical protein K1X94_25945 [Sandaracinaceae bacterium]|nr:hypothetical protein [Sandaracinaceae bacterium]